MDKGALKFLMKLLKTHSPSGAEENLQKLWLDYTKKFADVKTDASGNAIACINPDAKFKVLLTGHCDEIAMIVNKVDDKGFVYFSKVGGIDHSVLPGLKVDILGYGGNVEGVIGYARSNEGKKNKLKTCQDLFIDCGYQNGASLRKKIRTGDYILYKSEPEIINNDYLVCKALDNKTGSFIVAETLRQLSKKNPSVGCYAVSTTGEETNMRGAFFAGAGLKPDMAMICDVTFDTMAPGENTDNRPDISLGKGPALSIGSPINTKLTKIIEKAASKNKISIQHELTPSRTFTDADAIQFSGSGVPVSLVSLPLRYMHSPIEMAYLKDIDSVIKLLIATVMSLNSKTDLLPIRANK